MDAKYPRAFAVTKPSKDQKKTQEKQLREAVTKFAARLGVVGGGQKNDAFRRELLKQVKDGKIKITKDPLQLLIDIEQRWNMLLHSLTSGQGFALNVTAKNELAKQDIFDIFKDLETHQKAITVHNQRQEDAKKDSERKKNRRPKKKRRK